MSQRKNQKENQKYLETNGNKNQTYKIYEMQKEQLKESL